MNIYYGQTFKWYVLDAIVQINHEVQKVIRSKKKQGLISSKVLYSLCCNRKVCQHGIAALSNESGESVIQTTENY